ncbi:MAG: glycerol-3-phosphate dehydrogenase, partial [Bdellovibrionales bacterium]|nr:glycerol-3-phosphate dehydrogenase [Bdellovibrionales bacterium]
LITRGLKEMGRLIVTMGGLPETVSGLSGLGDLLLTATGDLSRNRRVGMALGRGESLDTILADLGQVAEGVGATAKILQLAARHSVHLPITEEVQKLLSGETTVQQSIEALLSRTRRSEHQAQSE